MDASYLPRVPTPTLTSKAGRKRLSRSGGVAILDRNAWRNYVGSPENSYLPVWAREHCAGILTRRSAQSPAATDPQGATRHGIKSIASTLFHAEPRRAARQRKGRSAHQRR